MAATTGAPDGGKASRSSGFRFPETPRFIRDGSSRIPNFLNPRDGEGREQGSPARVQQQGWDTNTHTAFADRLCGDSESAATLAREIAQSLAGRSAMINQKLRTATSLSLQFGDARHDMIRPPYSESLGPGFYDVIDPSSSPMGPLHPGSPSRGGSPARDPERRHSSFVSPERGEIFKPTEAGHLGSYLPMGYQSTTEKSHDWLKSNVKRADVSDFRYAARFSEARKKVPQSSDDPRVIGTSSLPNTLASAIAAKPAAVPFRSKQPRFAVLPKERHADLRLSSRRSDEDAGGLGPGTYLAYTSLGSATRNSYRMFKDLKGGQSHRHAHPPLSLSSGAPSSSFAGITRNHKYGPFTIFTDSSKTTRSL